MKKVLVYGMTNLTGGIENYIYNLTKEYFSLIFSSTLNLWLLKKR